MKALKTSIGILILTAYLMVGGFMMIGSMQHHEMSGCPFMPGEQAICQMDAFAHISAWQSMFASTVPTTFIIALLAVAILLAWQSWWPPPLQIIRSSLYERRRELAFIPLLQQLFSDGILNPKIP